MTIFSANYFFKGDILTNIIGKIKTVCCASIGFGILHWFLQDAQYIFK